MVSPAIAQATIPVGLAGGSQPIEIAIGAHKNTDVGQLISLEVQ